MAGLQLVPLWCISTQLHPKARASSRRPLGVLVLEYPTVNCHLSPQSPFSLLAPQDIPLTSPYPLVSSSFPNVFPFLALTFPKNTKGSSKYCPCFHDVATLSSDPCFSSEAEVTAGPSPRSTEHQPCHCVVLEMALEELRESVCVVVDRSFAPWLFSYIHIYFVGCLFTFVVYNTGSHPSALAVPKLTM